MFCVLSQNYQYFKKGNNNYVCKYASYSKLCKELENGIEILVGQAENSQNIVLINNSRTTWPTLVDLSNLTLSFLLFFPTVGVICAAPMMQGWYRAQVVEVYPERDECDIKFLDYGGYARIECTGLRQIRSDFMTLPFQAVESYLINLIPLPGNFWRMEECFFFFFFFFFSFFFFFF